MTQIISSLRSILNTSPPRITFVRSGALGDSILLLPAIQLLAQVNPEAEMQIVGSSWARRILSLSPHAWNFVPYDSAAMTRLFADRCLSLPPVLADADGIIVYTSSPEARLARNIRSLHRGTTIVHPISPPSDMHVASHLSSAITEEAPQLEDLPHPELQVPQQIRETTLNGPGNSPFTSQIPVVLLHPGSGSREKCWPAERYAQLAKNLDKQGIRPIGLQGPADREQCTRVSHECPSLRFFVKPNLNHVAGLLGEISVCVTNDCGIGHLAAAMGTPTISIFGPTNPCQWRPHGPKTTVLQSDATGKWPTVNQVLDAITQWI